MNDTVIRNAVDFIRELFRNEYSGHDASHTMRVYRTALRLAREEGADEVTVSLAALLHDADDAKLSPETTGELKRARDFMRSQGVDGATEEVVCLIIREVSFKGSDSAKPSTIEGMCVQDADRLDAIGAIGIGRAFAYGGSRGRPMYDPDIKPRPDMNAEEYRLSRSTTLNHFYEKLFLLKDMMNTKSARAAAERRESYMRGFIEEFLSEWEGKA